MARPGTGRAATGRERERAVVLGGLRSRWLWAALVFILPVTASAQETPDRWYLNLERSRIFYNFDNNTLYEAQIAPQLVVTQRLGALFTTDYAYGDLARARWHRGWSFSASPMVRLRNSSGRSKPVLPPSFMPHGVGQIFWVRSLARVPADATPLQAELGRKEGDLEMWSVQARLSHHSNGQDGCLYTTQTLTPAPGSAGAEPECTFQGGVGPDPDAINFDDGSFSTNFLRLSTFYRRLSPDADDEDLLESWFVGAGLEGHATMPSDQETLYGSWRWQAHAGVARRTDSGFFEGGSYVELHFDHAPDAADGVPSWSLRLEAYHLLDRLGGWGLFARLFHGQDYYNVAFVNEETFVQIGLAWAQDRFQVGTPTGGGSGD